MTVTIIGSSSGVSPTASASANISDSSTGRWNEMFTTSTKSTIRTVRRMISMPKRRDADREGGRPAAFRRGCVARWPSAVARPVRQTRIVAVPLMTEVPAKTAFDAPAGFSAPAAESAGVLFRRIGLAGQQRLVDEQVAAFEQPRSPPARGRRRSVRRCRRGPVVDCDRDGDAVAPNARLNRHRAAQRLDRILGAGLLDEIERHARP